MKRLNLILRRFALRSGLRPHDNTVSRMLTLSCDLQVSLKGADMLNLLDISSE